MKKEKEKKYRRYIITRQLSDEMRSKSGTLFDIRKEIETTPPYPAFGIYPPLKSWARK